jgi:radical SAM superfamily enzyme YgiQ (UPF0313 family)
MIRCLLVQPRFRSTSFWNYRDACEIMGARYPAAPLGLITVAAMLPAEWQLRLWDRNVQDGGDEMLDWPDLVLTGGMLPQQLDCLEVVHKAQSRGKTVVVGGPDPTSSPHVYGAADHLVLGEAEVTMPAFLEDLAAGRAEKLYQDERKADVTLSPCPRFDLLELDRYLHIGVQWCRGCPFNCEFCDIIELFGRVPRAKTTPQMLFELQRLYDLGYRGHVDLVDDNFIGNKKLVKQFLPHLRAWQEAHGWPFELSTEASVNIADDEALLGLMQEAGFWTIFMGIESPDEQTLIDTQKRQNARRSIVESVRKVYRHGISVNAGFILGFDGEKGSVAEGIIECIRDTAIPVTMTGLLYALPSTQLQRRLIAEGRLHEGFDRQIPGEGDQCTAGLNFQTRRPRLDILRDYLRVIETVYGPEQFFGRLQDVGLALDCSRQRFRPPLRRRLKELLGFGRLLLRLGTAKATRRPFFRALGSIALRNPRALRHSMMIASLYLHFGPFSRYVASKIREAIAREEQGALPVLASRGVA